MYSHSSHETFETQHVLAYLQDVLLSIANNTKILCCCYGYSVIKGGKLDGIAIEGHLVDGHGAPAHLVGRLGQLGILKML